MYSIRFSKYSARTKEASIACNEQHVTSNTPNHHARR